MKSNHVFYVLIILSAILLACEGKKESTNQTVRLKGQLIDMGSQEVRMSYNGASSLLGNSRDVILKTDEQGYFDTILTIKDPVYYNISRYTLYLSPGDDLTVKISQDNSEAEFSGIGSSVNNYMKLRLFPKGGSFLEAGRNITGDFLATKNTIDSLAAIRFHQLDTLSAATEEFKSLEAARIKADIVNSYMSYPTYAGFAKERNNNKFELPDRTTQLESMSEYIRPIIEEINDPKYLDVAVVRDVFSRSNDSLSHALFFSEVTIPQRTTELFEAASEVRKLSNNVSPETANEVSAYTQTMENKDFAEEINYKIAQASKLFPGKPAIDFELTDTDGNLINLSDFKGKVIYVDLWATWCGPCLKEAPFYEELATKYNSDEIVFLPISTDKNSEVWLKYLESNPKQLKQYHSVDGKLQEEWILQFIPRFLLIDKDFNIVDAYAPSPSGAEIKDLLDSLLS